MSNVVQPLNVGATDSMVLHFSEPMPEKYREPFFSRGLLAAAGVMLLAVFLGFVTVYSWGAGDVARTCFGAVFTVLMVLASFQCYSNWFQSRRHEYVKKVFVPFVQREVVHPVESWLQSAGLVCFNGEPPRLFADMTGEMLYYSFYTKDVQDAGAWMRSYRVDADGEAYDSGKAYSVSVLPAGKDAVKVSYRVLDNSDDKDM